MSHQNFRERLKPGAPSFAAHKMRALTDLMAPQRVGSDKIPPCRKDCAGGTERATSTTSPAVATSAGHSSAQSSEETSSSKPLNKSGSDMNLLWLVMSLCRSTFICSSENLMMETSL